ncbi:MAG TPA: nucleotide exchange factor GrpE, partial [Coxiellaceae bacterium]|nr:nucleotide exchange factor GrpE [Coxiellaceae bacterium]
RMEQEVTKARKFGVERLISELVPVVESLSRALENLPSDDHSKLTRQGIELTLDMLHKLLEKNGIVSIEPKAGDAFDPTQHEAMAMQPHPDGKSNAVIQVLQKGYALHGRVIKAAMVIVS